jgi:hypothetical protein
MEDKKYSSNEYNNRINKLNRFIVDLEFDNRQLRMEICFLYTKLSQKPPTAEDYERQL